MFDLKNAAGVIGNESNTLGNLVWYSIGEQLINRQDLLSKMQNAGLDEGFMPPEIRYPDAFRRATAIVERKGLPGYNEGVLENYLIRDVSNNSEKIIRFIVRETKDGKGKRLEYNPCVAEIIYNKQDLTVSWDSDYDNTAQEMCREVEKHYNLFLTHHNSGHIRTMVNRILASMAPTPVKLSGGVYFIPIRYESELLKMINLLQSLDDNTEGYRIPVINTKENKDMVRNKLNDHIKQTINSLAVSLKEPSLNKSRANPLLNEAKGILDSFQLYQETLDDEMMGIETMIDILKKQMLTVIDKLSNEKIA